MRISSLSWVTVAATTILAPVALADEPGSMDAMDNENLKKLSLEEMLNLYVETSSRRSERIEDAPNTMYVVTQEQIRKHGYHTLREVLRTIPGFGVFHKDIQFVAQVRGIAPNDNEKIALLINGHDISNVVEPDWLNGPIDLSIADRVEIVVGPGTVLYGTDALLAIINIITKTPKQNEVNGALGNVLKESTGIFGLRKAEDVYVAATATVMAQTGWDAWGPKDHDGAPLAGTTYTGQLDPSVFATLRAQVGEWSVQGIALDESFPDLKHAVSMPAGQDGKRYERVDSLEVNNEHHWNSSISTKFVASYDNKRMVRLFTAGDPTQQGESSYDLSQQTYKAEYSFHWETSRNYLQAGVQGRIDQNHNDYIFLWDPSNPTYTGPFNQIQEMVKNEDTYAIGLYASDSFKLLDRLKLVAAARVDKNTILDFKQTYFSPRAAVVYTPFQMWTTKLIYNTATRTPTVWASPLNNVWGVGNPAAPSWASVNPLVQRPEVLNTAEWQNLLTFSKTKLSLTIYYERLNDFISWGGPDTNVGNFTGEGGEFAIASSPLAYLTLWGNASYTHTHFVETASGTSFGNVPVSTTGEMDAVPAFTANAGADLELFNHLDLSLAFRYFTHQPTYYNENNTWGYSNNRFYVDFTIGYRDLFVPNLDVTGQIFNLSNNTDTVAAQYFQGKYDEQGFNASLLARYKF
jgi:iron complex outermembrane receptor protein